MDDQPNASTPRILSRTDDGFLAVDKPAGWLTIAGRQGSADPRPVLRSWLEAELGQRVWVLHRLDVPVSGLILFALSKDAHKIGNRAFEQRTVTKVYRATTEGPEPDQPEHRWVDKLRKGKKRAYRAPSGKQAVTRARVLGPGVRWELYPETGRTHQLRVQLALRGWPIRGDELYGAAPTLEPGIALRSIKLEGPFGSFAT